MFRNSFSEFVDKLILLVAMLVFLAMGILSIRNVRSLDTLSTRNAPMLSESKVDVTSAAVDVAQDETVLWERPERQSRGEDWVFDLFTPPVLFYNPASREFTVRTPELSLEKNPDPWRAFEIELVEIRQRPYRLQLVGYAGDDGNYVAYFELLGAEELLLAKEGRLLVEAGVKVLSFDVKQMSVEQEGSMPVFENVGVARILDYKSNEEILLTNVETKLFSELEATIRYTKNGETFVVREGSQIEIELDSYIIGALSQDPPEAMVTKVSTDGVKRLSKLLTPHTGEEPLNQGNGKEESYSPFAISPRISQPEPES